MPDPISIREAASKNYVHNKFKDPSVIKNTDHVDFNDKSLNNVHSIKVNSFPTLEEHLKPKYYVDQAISQGVDVSSLLFLDPKEKLKLVEQDSIVLNSSSTLPKTIIKLPTKSYSVKKFNDLSIIKNNTHVDFNDKNLDNVRFVKKNSMPAVREHLTPKNYVNQSISYHMHDLSLLRLDRDENLKLDEQNSIVFTSVIASPEKRMELSTKSYVDRLHEINRNRRDLSSLFNDQDNELDNNKLTNLDSVTLNRNPSSDNELVIKKYIDDELDKNTILTFNQALENYLKVSVGNDTYNITKHDKIHITDTTMIVFPNTGANLLQS